MNVESNTVLHPECAPRWPGKRHDTLERRGTAGDRLEVQVLVVHGGGDADRLKSSG